MATIKLLSTADGIAANKNALNNEIIDLTADDDDDDNDDGVEKPVAPVPAPYALPLLQIPSSHDSLDSAEQSRLKGASRDGYSRDRSGSGSSTARKMDKQEEEEEEESHLRPLKRQRTTGEPSSPGAEDQRRQHIAEALRRCLEEQIFPHVERVTSALSPDIYDLDKLGARVIRTIVNKDFERQFHLGQGRLSRATELITAAGIHRLVTELTSYPEYRRTPTSRLAPPTTTAVTAAVTTAIATATTSASAAISSAPILTRTPITDPTPPTDLIKQPTTPAILPSIEGDLYNSVNGHHADHGNKDDGDDADDADRDIEDGEDGEGYEPDVDIEDDDDYDYEEEDVDSKRLSVNGESEGPAVPFNIQDPAHHRPKSTESSEPPVQPSKKKPFFSPAIRKEPVHHELERMESNEPAAQPGKKKPFFSPAIKKEPTHHRLKSTESSEPAVQSSAKKPFFSPAIRKDPVGFFSQPNIQKPAPQQPKVTELAPSQPSTYTPQARTAKIAKTARTAKTVKSKQQGSLALSLRPYTSAQTRQQIASGITKVTSDRRSRKQSSRHNTYQVTPSHLFHIDMNIREIHYIHYLARLIYGKPYSGNRSSLRDIRNILKKKPGLPADLAAIHTNGYAGYDHPPYSLTRRSPADIIAFFGDLYHKRLNPIPQSLSIESSNGITWSKGHRSNQISNLLLSREVNGNRLGAGRTYRNFVTTVKTDREDYLEPQIEWTNCAGDIMTVSWLSNTDFICGTTTHSDSHNQQYNKPGNLLLGSMISGTLRAYPDHRIVRPVVLSGDNSSDSMVASQDPWLFTSVVSSDYDPLMNLAFTSSFDKTVKVWKHEGGSMAAVGTWEHGGRVNFVIASKNSTGAVATAADVPTEAVRVYRVDPSNISSSRYDSYSCTKVHDEDYVPSEKWAYYPAAIRWGLAESVNHLLLIGYSPRSTAGEDHEIPEDKLDTGELCLWDTIKRAQVKVNSAKTQNVFEVAWHPSRASFAAATSALKVLEKTDNPPRTQIRIFEMARGTGQYGAIKTLDCAAIDINELNIRPNCLLYSYIAASCTDGKVYIWDTAGDDLPMCILEHGDPIEELLGERDLEDVGVKFTSWATTADRLYTGSSDGVVKVWNIRHGRGVLIKDLMEAAAPITYGVFSPDLNKLVIGDASGRVHLLALDDSEDSEGDDPPSKVVSSEYLHIPTSRGRGQRVIRRPRPFLPHSEPPPPSMTNCDVSTGLPTEGRECAREYLQNGQLMLHPDPTIGAIQGANYASTQLFRKEAHWNSDPNEPLADTFQRKQQDYQRSIAVFSRESKLQRQPEQTSSHDILQSAESNGQGHISDESDLFLDEPTRLELMRERAEIDDSLVVLDYESSILDSDDDDGGGEDEDVDDGNCAIS